MKRIHLYTAVAVCAAAAASASASAQNFLERAIQERLQQTRQENIQAAEQAGDYSRSNPAPQKEEFTFSSPEGKMGVAAEVKGIQIGMPLVEVKKLVLASAKAPAGCRQGALPSGHPGFAYGDQVLYCENSYQYFGETAEYAEFFFVGDRLKYARLGTFYSENETKDPMPDIVRALADEKYKALPKVLEEKSRMMGRGKYQFIWTDPSGNRFSYATSYEHDLSGSTHKGGAIDLLSADFEQYTEDRRNALRGAAQQQQKALEQKKKGDL